MNDNFITSLDAIDKLLRPHNSLQEQIDRLLAPQRKIQDQMERFLEPQRRLQEQLNKYFEPQRKLQDQMERFLEPQRQLQRQMNKYLEPQRKFQNQIEKFLEPQRRLQELMNKYLEPQRKFQDQMERFLEPQRLIQEQISRYLTPLSEYLSDPLMDSVVVGSDGSISVSSEVIEAGTISESIESLSNDYSSTEEFLTHLFNLLEKLNSGVRIAIIYLVFPYFLAIIASLTTPIYEEWWQEYTGLDRRANKKEVVREANELYTPEELKDYRFVYASVLNVRDLGSTNSKIIDEIYLGKTVELIEKSKQWSFIEYQDSDTKSIRQGWVFTRYLHKFTK